MSKSLLDSYFHSEGEVKQTANKNTSKKEMCPCSKIAGLLFKAQLDAHFTHLLQKDKTLALHEAMAKFYESVDGLVDTFIETWMGLYPIEKLITEGSSGIDNPLEYFQNLYTSIDKIRQPIKESFLQNQIDEIQQLIAHTLYRLKNITD